MGHSHATERTALRRSNRRLGSTERPSQHVLLTRSTSHPQARVAEARALIRALPDDVVYVHREHQSGRRGEPPLRQGHDLSCRIGADALALEPGVDGKPPEQYVGPTRRPEVFVGTLRLQYADADNVRCLGPFHKDREGLA